MGSILISRIVQREIRTLRRHGLTATLLEAALRPLNAVLGFQILRGFFLGEPDRAFVDSPTGYTPFFLTHALLRDFVSDPANQMSPAFLDHALGKGDECFALLHGGELAAYAWFTVTPTPIDHAGLSMAFAPGYVYMYKAFTHPPHRGKRLYAVVKTMALAHYLAQGHKGIVCYVSATNFASLKSHFRMGCRQFGSLYIVELPSHTYTFATSGCRPYAFRLVADTPAAAVPAANPHGVSTMTSVAAAFLTTTGETTRAPASPPSSSPTETPRP